MSDGLPKHHDKTLNPAEVAQRIQAQPQEKRYIIGELLVQQVLQYLQNVGTGQMPGAALLKIYGALQALPELQQGPMAMPGQPQPAPVAIQPPTEAPAAGEASGGDGQ